MNQQNLLSLIQKTGSQLCIGIDPPCQPEERVSFALELIDTTHDLAVAYKLNRQYFLGTSLTELKSITDRIRKFGLISIMDHKLSDIGSTNFKAIDTMSKEGFDFFTLSPFPGNVEETANYARSNGLGTILLTLMSNPEAKYMVEGDNPIYKRWATEAQKYCEGMVVGSTGHVTEDHLENLRSLAPNPFILAPGLGAQGGSPERLMSIFGSNVIFNVSRAINNATDKRAMAEKFVEMINSVKM